MTSGFLKRQATHAAISCDFKDLKSKHCGCSPSRLTRAAPQPHAHARGDASCGCEASARTSRLGQPAPIVVLFIAGYSEIGVGVKATLECQVVTISEAKRSGGAGGGSGGESVWTVVSRVATDILGDCVSCAAVKGGAKGLFYII